MIRSMRSRVASVVFLLVTSLHTLACSRPIASPQGPSSSPATLRVLVFNIHAGKDASQQPNLDEVARLVREHDVDVALLQEVDRGTKRSGGVDQVQVLAEKGAVEAVLGRSLYYDGGEYGVAVLARGGLASHRTHPLPVSPPQERSGGAHEPRVALAAIARTPIGQVQVVNTHLDASRDDHYRLQEAARVLAIVEPLRRETRPLVIGGDFNAEPGSAVVERLRAAGLRDAWTECGQGEGLTFPAHAPVKRIDYLFLTGALRCTRATVLEATISDHRPLLVTLSR
jgi:endonuclease/exonuclease/phosphatase family metal-dependent hydrolase